MPETSEVRERVLTAVALGEDDDIATLFRRLILFEEVVLDCLVRENMDSLIALARRIGTDKFELLVDSGAVKIKNGWVLNPELGNIQNPPLGLNRSVIYWLPDPSDIEAGFAIDKAIAKEEDLSESDGERLGDTLYKALTPFNYNRGRVAHEHYLQTVERNSELVARAAVLAVRENLKVDVSPDALKVSFERINDEEVMNGTSNLCKLLSITREQESEILRNTVMVISNVSIRLEEMMAYRALGGFTEREFEVTDAAFRFVVDEVGPDAQEERFRHIVSIAGLPEPGPPESVNVEALIEARASLECREFRQWLRKTDGLGDREIRERVDGISEQVSGALRSTKGRVARFAFTSGIGFVPVVGPVANLVLGALDEFVLDDLLRDPGPVSFLSSSYGSIVGG